MLPHHQTFQVWVLFQLISHHNPKIETGTLPGNPADLLLKDILGEAFLIFAGSNGDDRNGVHVVHMPEGN